MPTYEYECKKCGVFEVEQRISEDALTKCPTCAKDGKTSKVERLISAPAFHLKGGGWYKDAYASTQKSSSSTSSTESAPSTSEAPTIAPKSESSTTAATEKKSLKTVKDSGGCGGGCSCK